MPAYAKRQGRLLLPQRTEVQREVQDLGFNDGANLDEGAVWPIYFALKKLTDADEKSVPAHVKKQ
jgi:hypothetical protein